MAASSAACRTVAKEYNPARQPLLRPEAIRSGFVVAIPPAGVLNSSTVNPLERILSGRLAARF
jgi:hypothetical protein